MGRAHRRGSHPGRGEPADPHPRRPGARPGREGHAGRQRRLPAGARSLRRYRGADPIEARARARHLNYVKVDGEVGIIGNGAGLVMSTLDVVAYAGEEFGGMRPANFLDIGGGASAEVMADGLDIVLSTSVRSVLVNVFGGITSCDAVANGIVKARSGTSPNGATKKVRHPIVVRLYGNNAAEGRRILTEANISVVEQVGTMDDAARRAAELASLAATGA